MYVPVAALPGAVRLSAIVWLDARCPCIEGAVDSVYARLRVGSGVVSTPFRFPTPPNGSPLMHGRMTAMVRAGDVLPCYRQGVAAMPMAHVGEIELYYETQGSGAPLLLIAGLNSDHGLFRTLVPPLSANYRVIVFDNRGIGRSTGAETPFTMETLADDAAGLLHALGIERAHILGVSLGGRIAAALALRHPELTRSLILVSTTMEPPPQSWHQRWVGLLIRLPMIRHGSPYAVVARQRAASRAFNCTERLAEIRASTLIMHGRRDALAPAGLVRRMQAGISGSQLATFNGGHLFFLLRARPFLERLGAFLESSQAPLAEPGDH